MVKNLPGVSSDLEPQERQKKDEYFIKEPGSIMQRNDFYTNKKQRYSRKATCKTPSDKYICQQLQ